VATAHPCAHQARARWPVVILDLVLIGVAITLETIPLTAFILILILSARRGWLVRSSIYLIVS
jgi:hypothetical protein